ncbi:hypothetical protein CTZ27_33435 [Streptomyces griseocarneus]|nr:hypothetical protein CTZ27_33435 [Streptomyces griseocarneus]
MSDSPIVPAELLALAQASQAAQHRYITAESSEREEALEAWRQAADAVLTAIATHAAETGENRYELEMAVKRTARSTAV